MEVLVMNVRAFNCPGIHAGVKIKSDDTWALAQRNRWAKAQDRECDLPGLKAGIIKFNLMSFVIHHPSHNPNNPVFSCCNTFFF
ncbi:MAG: hypothetical protein ACXWCZ_04260, partial [Flavisolibacter sp.]